MSAKATTIKLSSSFQDQKPGTSGLRKKVKLFKSEHYTESFIQATLEATTPEKLVVGGDGRYFSRDAIQIIVKMAVVNGVKEMVIGKSGILSTPAASNLIRIRKASGGILLTASHNPEILTKGGLDNDFGIKYNISNGGPAPEAVTEKIFEISKELKEYKICDMKSIDLDTIAVIEVGGMRVEIVDGIADYVSMVKEIFDFEAVKTYLKATPSFTFLFDSMHAVTGPYAKAIFVQELGLPASCVINGIPKEDFAGGHPDPNLTYAHELVELVEAKNVSMGAASDGDGDRNMIIGKGTFINPSDSVAIIAANAHAIPFFKNGVKGLARSMPTSAAIDRVGEKLGYKVYEVPTGWKFFGNLMDAGLLSICGEESFGTGSDHIREKDGIWAVLAWLSILASANSEKPGTSLQNILDHHYSIYGRNYFSRYDFEEVASEGAGKMMELLRGYITDKSFTGKKFGNYTVKLVDDFSYTDPIDKSVSTKQGLRVIFTDGSRFVFRLSGTGSQGATVRLYVEKYDAVNTGMKTQDAIKDLIDIALGVSQLEKFTGRSTPTVIT